MHGPPLQPGTPKASHMDEGGGQENHDDAVSQDTEVPPLQGTHGPASQGQHCPSCTLVPASQPAVAAAMACVLLGLGRAKEGSTHAEQLQNARQELLGKQEVPSPFLN